MNTPTKSAGLAIAFIESSIMQHATQFVKDRSTLFDFIRDAAEQSNIPANVMAEMSKVRVNDVWRRFTNPKSGFNPLRSPELTAALREVNIRKLEDADYFNQFIVTHQITGGVKPVSLMFAATMLQSGNEGIYSKGIKASRRGRPRKTFDTHVDCQPKQKTEMKMKTAHHSLKLGAIQREMRKGLIAVLLESRSRSEKIVAGEFSMGTPEFFQTIGYVAELYIPLIAKLESELVQ